MIYASNLCTEIAQNMSAMHEETPEIMDIDGETVVVTKTVPGDFVVCNLASLSLGHIDVDNDEELRQVISTVMRALDNVIDLNGGFRGLQPGFPVPGAHRCGQR